jgi:hypothetical protein
MLLIIINIKQFPMTLAYTKIMIYRIRGKNLLGCTIIYGISDYNEE